MKLHPALLLLCMLLVPVTAFSDTSPTHNLGDTGIPADYEKILRVFPADSTADLLEYYDARTCGWVTPAKNQGSCGGCWSYTATGVFESHLLQNGHPATAQQEYQQIYNNSDMGAATAETWSPSDGGNTEIWTTLWKTVP